MTTTVTVAQWEALVSSHNISGVYIIDDTAAAITGLPADDIFNNITEIESNDTTLVLNLAQAVELLNSDGAGNPTRFIAVSSPNGKVILADSLSNLEAYTPNFYETLETTGINAISVAYDALVLENLSLAQIQSAIAAGVTELTVLDDIRPEFSITQLAALGEGSITINEPAGVSLSVSDLISVESNQATLIAAYVYDVTATPADFTNNTLTTNVIENAPQQVVAITADGSVTLTVDQALALENASLPISVPSGDSVTLVGSASALQGLSDDQLAALETIGVTEIATSDDLQLGVQAALALYDAGITIVQATGPVYLPPLSVNVEDVPGQIASLTPQEIDGLAGFFSPYFSGFEASPGLVTLSVGQWLAFVELATPNTNPPLITLTKAIADTADKIETLTAADITALEDYQAFPPVPVTVTEGSTIDLSLGQAVAIVGTHYQSQDNTTAIQLDTELPSLAVTITDTVADFQMLTADQVDALAHFYLAEGPNVTLTAIMADGSVALGTAQAEAAVADGFSFSVPTDDSVSIGDFASNITAFLDLGAGEVQQVLRGLAIVGIAATDGSIALSVSEAETLETADANAGLGVAVTAQPPGATVTLSGTPGDIMGMSPQQLAGLSAIGVTAITVQGTSITLSVEQALALFDPVRISVEGGGSVIVAGPETAIDSLTAAEFTELAAVGVNTVEVSSPTGAGPLTIGGGITTAIDGAVPANQTITFVGIGGTLSLDDTAAMAGTIYGFSPPDTIDLTDVAYDPGGSAGLGTDPNDGLPAIQIAENNTTYYLDIDPSQIFPTPPTFELNPDAGTGTDLTVVEPPLTLDYISANYFEPVLEFDSGTADGIVLTNDAVVDASNATVNRAIVQNSGELIGDVGSTINDAFIQSGGELTASFATVDRATVESGGELIGNDNATIDGTVIESGGALMVTDFSVTMNDTLIESRGLLDLELPGNDLGTITFGPADGGIGGTLEIDDDNNGLVATIFGFAPGDTIDLTDVPYQADGHGSASLGFDPNDSQPAIVVDENGNTYYFDVDPAQTFTDDSFVLTPDSGGTGTDVTVVVSRVTNFQEKVEVAAGGAPAYLWSNAANWTNGLPTEDAVVNVDIPASGNPGGYDDIAALTLNRLTLTEGDIVIRGSLTVSGGLVVGGAASLTIAAGGLLDLSTGAAASGTIDFGPSIGNSSNAETAIVTDTDPALVAPVILTPAGGGPVERLTTSDAPVEQLFDFLLEDNNAGATDTLTITLSGGGGTLTDGTSLLTPVSAGVYTLTGTAAAITTELEALVFTPTAGAPGTSATTTFTLSDVSSVATINGTVLLTATTPFLQSNVAIVTDTDPALVAPVILTPAGGGPVERLTTSDAPVEQLFDFLLEDNNAGATDTLTITLSGGGGTLTDGTSLLTPVSAGVYTLTGTAAAITTELEALVFTPTAGAPGTSATTTFTLSDVSSVATINGTVLLTATTPFLQSNVAIVTDTDPALVAPVILTPAGGGPVERLTTSDAPVEQLFDFLLEDNNAGATDTLTITLSGGGGTLTDGTSLLTPVSAGVYTLTGTAAAITTELEALVFTPTAGAPGTSATTTFTLSDVSSVATINGTVLLTATTPFLQSNVAIVTDTDPALVAPVILTPAGGGPVERLTTSDAPVEQLFDFLLEDNNAGATDTLTITLSGGGGTLTDGTSLLTPVSAGVYTLTGTAAAITTELEALVFTPTAGAPGTSATTTFTLSDVSSVATINGTVLLTATTPFLQSNVAIVTDTDPALVAPVILTPAGGGPVERLTTSDAPVEQLFDFLLEDNNAGATDTLTITLSGGGGTLTDGTSLLTPVSAGVYTLTGTAAAITTELEALVFTPTAGAPGTSATTTFTLSDVSSVATINGTVLLTATTPFLQSNVAIVTDTDPALVAPVILTPAGGGPVERLTTSDAPVEQLFDFILEDNNAGATDTLTITLSGGGGTLTDGTSLLTPVSAGVYTLTGTAAAITTELEALVFTPTAGAPGTSATTTFTLSDVSSVATINGTVLLTATTPFLQSNVAIVTDTDPALVAPVILTPAGGGPVERLTTSDAPVEQLFDFLLEDNNAGATDTLTITLSGGGGTLTDGTSLLTPVSAGVYTLTGTAAAITTELEALVFTPTAGAPGTSATTTFTLSDVSSVATINGTVLLTATTPFLQSNVAIVTDTDPALVAPVILTPAGGGPVERLTTSDAPVEQLFDFILEDNNAGATDTLTITLSGGGGTLTDGTSLLTPVSAGVYTLTGTAAAITTELEALVFTPTAGAPGTSATTTFTLSDVSSVATINGTVLLTATTPFLQSNVAIVTDTDPALVAPVILTPAGGGPVERLTTSDAPVEQLFDFLLEDNNAGATDTLTITLSGGGGTLTDGTSLLTPVSAGVYTLTGTAAAITTELEALVFTPTAGAPGTSATTTFTLSDVSSVATINGTVLLTATTPFLQSNVAIVTDTDPALVAPVILTPAGGGPVERLTTSDAPVEQLFDFILEDNNAGATDTLTITLSGGGGTLTDGTSLLTPVSAGVYTLTGTAAAITTELEALVFTPTAGAPGTSATTTFTLSDVSSVATINGTLEIDDTSELNATIDGFGVGDTINLSSLPYNTAGSAGLEPDSNNVLQIVEDGTSYTLDLDPTQDYVGHNFLLSPDTVAGGTDITVGRVPLIGPVTVPAGEAASDVVVASGGTLTVAAGGTATGTTVETGGELVATAGSTITDSVIDYGGVLDLATGAAASGTINFGPPLGDPVGGTLEIDGTTELNATITGFAEGDTIDLTAIPYDPDGSANLVSGNVLDVNENSGIYTLHFDPTQNFTGDYFHLSPDSGGTGTDITESTTPCYCRGTLIQTQSGETRVEKLKIGDMVMTMSGVARPIKWIGKRSYGGRFIIGQKEILPICIRAGALEDNVPRRNLWISPHHAMYLDGALIEAKDLVNGVSIVQAERVEKVEYFHIELESHDVILAEGAPSESFIDDASRGTFHNAHEYRVMYPHDAATAIARYCAPRLDHGYEVEALRLRLALRAGIAADDKAPRLGTLRGYVERITPHVVEGWAQSVEHPEAPVCLDIYAGGRVIGQVLANGYREDLKKARLGSGHHGFEFKPPDGLAFAPEGVEVRRSLDGRVLFSAEARRTLPKHHLPHWHMNAIHRRVPRQRSTRNVN